MNTEWKLVPVEPTDEMEVAAENDYEQTGATFPRWKSAYAAMMNAAPPAPTSHPIPTGATGEAIKLVHLAVAEDGGVRFMAGRKLPDGIESCELYAMPDYGRAPAELFRAPAAGDAQLLAALQQAHMALIGFMPQHRNAVIVDAIVAARQAIDAAIALQKGEENDRA